MLSLRTINAMSATELMETFGGTYESSSWIVLRVKPHRPFASTDALLHRFKTTVDSASKEEQDFLIRAHPDLAGNLARAGQLTTDSTREQSRLGLNQLDAASYARFGQLNQDYQKRFQFSFISCVGLLQDRQQVLDAFVQRIQHPPVEERQETLRQIHLIAQLRLAALMEGIPTP